MGWKGPLARRLSARFSDLVVERFAVRELRHFARDRLMRLLGQDAAEALNTVLDARQALLDEAIETLRLQYPSYVENVQARYLQRAGLRFEERTLRQLHDEAVISMEILVDLEREIRGRWSDVERPPELDLGLATGALLSRVPLFAGLPEDRLRKIETLVRPLLTVPDELVVRRGERGDAMYFIASGAVSVDLPTPVRLGTGDFFGEMALVYDIPRNADVRSLGYCRLLVLSKRDLDRLYGEDPELRTHINAVASRRQAAG
jgi:CPA1 family monovalent cation:H+ antiporter